METSKKKRQKQSFFQDTLQTYNNQYTIETQKSSKLKVLILQ